VTTTKEINIRALSIDDYDDTIALWKVTEGLFLNESDSREAIASFIARNPGLSAVARTSDGALAGAVLCGHTGRAGFLHHLAVARAHRGKGVAKKLLAFCMAGLTAANIARCNIFVYNDNEEGNRFWREQGWADPTTWKVMQKILTQ
jgi:N-acetylglutamate synthase